MRPIREVARYGSEVKIYCINEYSNGHSLYEVVADDKGEYFTNFDSASNFAECAQKRLQNKRNYEFNTRHTKFKFPERCVGI